MGRSLQSSSNAFSCVHIATTHMQVFPNRTEETYPVVLPRVVYIEETDFRDHDSKDYYGLAPGKSILLK